LFDKSRRQSNLKNRVDEPTEQTVLAHAIDYPAHGQLRVSNELCKAGVFVSPSGVRSIWLRHRLANFKDRLKALEAKVAGQGLILTEAQVAALEKKRQDDEFNGEIETAHPGYLNAVDLSSTKPSRQLFLRCSTTYIHVGIPEGEGVRALKSTALTWGLRTLFMSAPSKELEEFYQVALRKNLYNDLSTLQKDLDEWLNVYNNHRTHQGKMCCGRTPMGYIARW
jgi:hypothetical protein